MDKSIGFNFARVFIVAIVFGFQVIQLFILSGDKSNVIVYLFANISISGGYILDSFCINDSFAAKAINILAKIALSVNFGAIVIVICYVFANAILNDANVVFFQEIYVDYIISTITLLAIGVYFSLCIITLIYVCRKKSTK